MKTTAEVADKYFESSQKLASRTTNIILIATLVLVAIWILDIETSYEKFVKNELTYGSKINDINSQISEVNNKFTSTYKTEPAENPFEIKKISSLDSSAIKNLSIPQSHVKVEAIKSYRQKINNLRNQKQEIQALQASVKEKISDVKDWPTLIKFIFLISDNPETGSSILSIQILCLVLFAYYMRAKFLKTVAKGIRIYADQTNPLKNYQDYCIAAPFWVAPLPNRTNYKVNSETLKTILGWSNIYNFLLLFLGAFFLVIIGIQFRIVFIVFVNNRSLLNGNTIITLFSAISTLFILISWLLPAFIADNYNFEAQYKLPPQGVGRRKAIVISGYVALSALALIVVPKWANIDTLKKKRFVKNKRTILKDSSKFLSSLVVNRKSQVVHFINASGHSTAFNKIKNETDKERFFKHIESIQTEKVIVPHEVDKEVRKFVFFNSYPDSIPPREFATVINISPTAPKQVIPPHMPNGRSSWYFENLSKALIMKKDIALAKQVLLLGITYNGHRDYRLYDFLAIICIRTSDTKTLDILSKMASSTKDSRIVQKVVQWKSPYWIERVKRYRKEFDGFPLEKLG